MAPGQQRALLLSEQGPVGEARMALREWLERRALRLPGGTGAILLDDADREIAALRRPPTERALEDAVARSSDVNRYRVFGRALFRGPRTAVDKPWFSAAQERFEGMVDRLLSRTPGEVEVPDFAFGVNLGDYPVRGAPILTAWSKVGFGNARIPSVVHWPVDLDVSLDDDAIRAHYAFEAGAVERPWSDRLPRVAWRGSATGMYDRTFRWSRLAALRGAPLGRGVPRLDLCRTAEAHPDLFDAAITAWPQVSGRVRARLEQAYGTAARVPNSWFLRHRFVMNVDGNVGTTSFLTFVGAGSVVLKQDSPYLDWCAHHLGAGTHYVAVARDLSDLVPVARGALADPEGAREIVAAGRAFAGRFLTGAAIDLYLLALLDRYARAWRSAGGRASGPAGEPGRGFVRVS